MKNILKTLLLTCTLMFSSNMSNFAQVKVEGKLSWSKLKRLEKEMEKWSKKVTKKGMVEMGKMNQRPREIEVIRSYFPYLLPKNFFSYQTDMSCYPDFSHFKEKKSESSYRTWQSCLKILHRESMPHLLRKALQDLKPSA